MKPNKVKYTLLILVFHVLFSACSSPLEVEESISKPAEKQPTITQTVGTQPTEQSPTKAFIPWTAVPTNSTMPTQYLSNQSPDTSTIQGTMELSMVDDYLGKNMVVVIEYWFEAVYLFDVNSGLYRQVFDLYSSVGFWGWSNNGCELIVGPKQAIKGSIVKIDLQGNVIEEMTYFDWETLPAAVVDVSLSPSHGLIAYILGYSEESSVDPDFQDLYIALTNDPENVVRLTENGGAWDVAWSSKDSLIAYTDYDDNGIHQLYISKPDGTITEQLTSFDDSKNEIRSIAWSPDDKLVAFYYGSRWGINTDAESIKVISLEQGQGMITSIANIQDERIKFVNGIWWEDELTIVADILFKDTGMSKGGMFWIDVKSTAVDKQILQGETPEKYWEHAIPLGDIIVLLTFDNFWVMDIKTRLGDFSAEKFVHMVSDWASAPSVFLGEEFCVP